MNLTVAAAQINIAWEDKSYNLSRIKRFLQDNLPENVDILIFPEMFLTGFTMNGRAFSETPFAETENFLKEIAKQSNCLVGGGWIENNDPLLPYNTFSLYDPFVDSFYRYRKIHPFSFASEDKYYSAGEFQLVIKYKGFHISPFICYDLRFPELFRKTAGTTDLYIGIANWPEVRMEHWSCLLKARAIENQAYVLGVNRVGTDGKIRYAGGSKLISPFGKLLTEEANSESIIIGSVSLGEVKETRKTYPFLRDKKIN